MSSVLGIDVSSHAIDMVKLDETTNDAEWTRIELLGGDSFIRLRGVERAMPWRHRYYDDVYICGIEVPKTRFLKSAGALFPIYGAVVALLPPNLQVWDVHPKTWRQGIGLPGNATKEDVRVAVYDLWDGMHDLIPQDAVDAYAVAYHVRETNRRAIEAAA